MRHFIDDVSTPELTPERDPYSDDGEFGSDQEFEPNYDDTQIVLLASWVNIGHMLAGYAAGWTAPVLPMLRDPQQTILPYTLNHIQTSWIASLVFVGIIIGPFVFGSISNTKGRQPCLVIGGVITTTAFVMKTIPIDVWSLYAARIFMGLGMGIIITTNLIYLTEIASPNLRGTLLSTTGTSSSLGTLAVYCIAPYVPYAVTGYVGLIVSLIFTVGSAFLPETPVFYILIDQEAKAREILNDLDRPNDLEDLIATKVDPISLAQQIKRIFTVKSNRRATYILVALNTLQGLSGCNAVLFFSTTIFDMARTTHDSNISTIVIGLTLLFSSCLTPLIIGKSGRRMLLLISTAMCSVSLISLGACFYLDEIDHPYADSIEYLPILSLMTFLLSYNIGFAIIPATFTGEMFDSTVRGPGSSFTLIIGWMITFIITTTFAYTVSVVGAAVTFWVYASSCAVAFMFTVVFVPETKGKSLLEIQNLLSK
ncbi:hypothetical protein K1T71_013495 [Dendrolimus kikuchii]|uniref:Uncharacterized protein n=1 Tax=Dendrolimus kikuchii TaxID=765133 RepID=A0ACC1CGL0_9NEOP|nr:hypothetical protein K1T71_013495 [Dendrolimus kikuchii]